MKALQLLTFIFFLSFISCKEDKPKNNVKKNNVTASVKHYICKDNCENSGGDAAGNCPTCKKPYLHNQAFHDKDLLKNGPLTVPQDNQNQTNSQTPSPAQNALGVFHYTCNNGCFGGAGTAAKCTTCGETLAHNTTYHNN